MKVLRSILPIIAMIIGLFLPGLYIYSFLIKYLLILLLFLAFLGLQINYFYWNSLKVVLANLAIALFTYIIISYFDRDLALVGFITAISPTATAAPSIIQLLKGNVQYVTISVILTNLVVALTIPFLIAFLAPHYHNISTTIMLRSVLSVITIPLFLSQIISQTSLYPIILPWKPIAFYVWNILLIIATARASHFIFYETTGNFGIVILIAITSLIICIINFSLGRLIGGKQFAREASQSLGQKNTMFTVWLSLAFLNPLLALGPMFYLIYHNFYNAYQLLRINLEVGEK